MDSFMEDLAAAPADQFPDWEDGSDLARLHVQAFVRDHAGGFELGSSRGALRLSGGGVQGHTVSISDAGVILASFQTLVTSAGASSEGVTHPRGRVPDEVLARTKLLLNASPGPGSVVLDFEPAVDEAAERYPDGQAAVEEITPLIETSMDIAFQVLELAGNANVGELADEKFRQWGPRVASAARELADAAAKADIDINAAWEKPSVGRRRVNATAVQLAALKAILKSRGLDSPEEVLEGVLRTVSDRRKIELEVRSWAESDDESESDSAVDSTVDDQVRVVPIKRGTVSFTGFSLGDRVSIRVKVRVLHRPGSADMNEYTAVGVQRVGKPTLPK
ncbi:hypothetical protein QN239_20290 [Mycolicibacterium sp. Y3]